MKRKRLTRIPDRPPENPHEMPLSEVDWDEYGIRETRLSLIKQRHALRKKKNGRK